MRLIARHGGLAGILLLVGALYLQGLGKHGMFMWDEAHYAVLGRALARGQGYVDPAGRPESLRPPLLPAAIAAVLRIAPTAGDAALLRLSVATALLLAAVVYGCVYREGGAFAAASAALLFATFPEILRSTSFLLTELPLALFYTPAVFLFHRGLYVDSRYFLIAWPCFALALMTRYTAVLFGPTALLLCAIPLLLRDEEAVARLRSRHFWLGPVVAAAMLAPLFVRAWQELGDPLIGFRAASQQLPKYSQHAQMPAHYYLSAMPSMIGWLSTAALGFSIARTWAQRDRLALSCTIAAIVVIAWMSQYGWKEPRLVSASLPFLAIVIGLGLQHLWRDLADRDSASPSSRAQNAMRAAAIAAFAIAVQLDPSYARATLAITRTVTLGYPSFATAMREIRETSPPSTVLMGENGYQIAWYADRACHRMPSDRRVRETGRPLQDTLTGIDYLVLTSFERGQPSYAADVLARAKREIPEQVATHRDERFWTVIIDARVLADLYEATDEVGGSDATGPP